jgi:flagellar protein FlbD
MIHLTRLNGNSLVVNCDLIKYAESSPDTVLTLVNGEKIVVLESCQEVVDRTVAYRAGVFAAARTADGDRPDSGSCAGEAPE